MSDRERQIEEAQRALGEVVHIARCPEHGLHGERETCFECGRPCEQIAFVEARALAKARDALAVLPSEPGVERHTLEALRIPLAAVRQFLESMTRYAPTEIREALMRVEQAQEMIDQALEGEGGSEITDEHRRIEELEVALRECYGSLPIPRCQSKEERLNGSAMAESRLMICPTCGRETMVVNWYARPICVHAWDGGVPEVWDGDNTNGEGRKVEESPSESFRVPGPGTWSQMLPRYGVLSAQSEEGER